MKSTTFAGIILVILIALLGYVTYIKFTYQEEPTNNNQNQNQTQNSISLNTVANNYNSNSIASSLGLVQVQTTATINENTLNITYNDKNYVFTFNNGILENTTNITDEAEEEIIKNIAIILYDAISTSKNNTIGDSILTGIMVTNGKYTTNEFTYSKTDNNITIKLDTTKQIVFYTPSIIYDKLTILDIGTNNYALNMLNTSLTVISCEYIEENNSIIVDSYLEPIENNNKTVVFKIYKKKKKELKSIETKLIDITTNRLEIAMELGEIAKDNVSSYSLEIKESD